MHPKTIINSEGVVVTQAKEMAQTEQPYSDMQFLLADLNTRIRDAEERNRITKERTLLIGKNLVDTKDEMTQEIRTIKRDIAELQRVVQSLKKATDNLVQETAKYTKREEIMMLERMLKDFQPLEFVRMKDLDTVLKERLHKR